MPAQLPAFESGRTYFTRDGRQVSFIGTLGKRQHVVHQIVELQTYDGIEHADGPITVEPELFLAAPRELVDVDLRKAEDRLRELEGICAERTSSALTAEREVRQRLDALKKYRGLERIEDFIEGRITHFVCPVRYGNTYEIKTLDDFEERDYGRPQGVKLISLFGKSNGDLTWRVNDYRDGSGGNWDEIVPCASAEDAEEKRLQRIAADLAEQSESFDPERPYYFMMRVQAALQHGVPVSAVDMARYRKAEDEDLKKKRAEVEKEIEARQARLDALQPIAGEAA